MKKTFFILCSFLFAISPFFFSNLSVHAARDPEAFCQASIDFEQPMLGKTAYQTFKPTLNYLTSVAVYLNGLGSVNVTLAGPNDIYNLIDSEVITTDHEGTYTYYPIKAGHNLIPGETYYIYMMGLSGDVSWLYATDDCYSEGTGYFNWQLANPRRDYGFLIFAENYSGEEVGTDSIDEGMDVYVPPENPASQEVSEPANQSEEASADDSGQNSDTTTNASTKEDLSSQVENLQINPSSEVDNNISPPKNLVAEAKKAGDNHVVQLTWGASDDSDIDGYKVFRKTNSEEFLQIYKTQKKVLSLIDTQVAASNSYTYIVRAYTDNKESASSNETTIKIDNNQQSSSGFFATDKMIYTLASVAGLLLIVLLLLLYLKKRFSLKAEQKTAA